MKKILLLLVCVGAIGAGYGIYMYNKPHASIKNMHSEHSVSAVEIQSAYDQDETAANASYLGKVLTITGELAEVNQENNENAFLVMRTESMMSTVKCQLDQLTEHPKLDGLKVGDQITIKGICTGYLMDVIIERAIIL